MARTLDLFANTEFAKPRQPRLWRMHVTDARGDGPDGHDVIYTCLRCGLETDWTHATSVSQAKRGIPCPVCNLRLGSKQEDGQLPGSEAVLVFLEKNDRR